MSASRGSRFDLPVVTVGALGSGGVGVGLAVLFGSWADTGPGVGPTAAALDEGFSQLLGAMLGLAAGAAAVAALARRGSRIAGGIAAAVAGWAVVLTPVLVATGPNDVSTGDSLSVAVLVLFLALPIVVLGALIGAAVRARERRAAAHRRA